MTQRISDSGDGPSAVLSWAEDAASVRSVLDAVAAVVVTDRQGQIREANNRFYQLSGFLPAEVAGKDFCALTSLKFPRDFAEIWQDVLLGQFWEGDVAQQSKSGGIYWLHMVLVPVQGATGQEIVFVGQDITRFRRDSEGNAIWLRSNLWLERVKQDYLSRRRASPPTRRILSVREEQVLRLVAEGLASKNIATQLNISVRTVEIHRAHILKKLGLRTTAALVRYALENGYTA